MAALKMNSSSASVKGGARARTGAVRTVARKAAAPREEGVKKAVAGAALSAFLAAGAPAGLLLSGEPAHAGPLVPCADSKAFKKREKKEIKDLEKRLKLVRARRPPPGRAPRRRSPAVAHGPRRAERGPRLCP